MDPAHVACPAPVAAGDADLETPVQFLRGVGPRRAGRLAALGIRTVADLLWHLPFRYEDRRNPRPLAALEPGCWQAFRARVVRRRRAGAGSRARWIVHVSDASGSLDLVWFRAPFIGAAIETGREYHFYGFARASGSGGRVTVANPEFEAAAGDPASPAAVMPVYPGTDGLTQRFLRTLAGEAARRWHDRFAEFLPRGLLDEKGFPERGRALLSVHAPDTPEIAALARRRLAYEELFTMQLALARVRHERARRRDGVVCADGRGMFERFEHELPFRFTAAQRRVLDEIRADMASPRAIARLLQGDVGSGKTAVALTALLAACGDGYQGALMAPTETLAEQHHRTIAPLCARIGVACRLAVGRQGAGTRRLVEQEAADGSAGIVVGTHALIEDRIRFRALGLVVIDEQHRFGVCQRDRLVAKGSQPNVLVTTATPIPRTLALTVYGDLDVSVLDELPPGRQPISTHWVPPSRLPAIWRAVDERLAVGRQAYVVCPLVEESEEVQRASATDLYEALRIGPFAHRRVGLLHGQLPPARKDEVMDAFRCGSLDVLVATTVVEVGVDVPNATAMVVMDASAFGLAQLHQLRGRIGRGSGASTCWLVAGSRSGTSVANRLSTMVRTQDGFEIARADLEIRGPGEMFGPRQSGLTDLKVADLVRDLDTIEEARADARRLVAADPHLAAPELAALRAHVTDRARSLRRH
jgi:ATP-dependent DNA helicase RecG